ncbi:MAG: hypothetical protein FJ214_07985 [Ignavibacteria bacterium]|nr:hypothetical protein [Ignavibacteria bacterium]
MIDYVKNTIVLGVRAVFYNYKIVFLLWIFNAASAIVLTLPFYEMLSSNLGRSLISDQLSFQFDYMWYVQIRNLYNIHFAQLPLSIIGVVAIYTILQTFFLGGLIAIFHTPEKNHIVDFFYGGVKYFYRFVKVLFFSLLFYVVAFKFNDYSGDLIRLLFYNSENIKLEFVLLALRYTLLVFFIGVINIITDYSKVSLAINDRTAILKEIYSAILFIKNNFLKVFITFLIVAIIGALGVIIYNVVGRFIPRTPYYLLVIAFILQQMLIIFRLLVRMLFCATEVHLFKDLSADTIRVEVHQS